MIAKIAYLTTPGPNRFVLNIQTFGCDDIQQFEISKHHLANILVTGVDLAMKEQTNTASMDRKK